MFQLYLQINCVHHILSLKVTKECSYKRQHNLAKNQDQYNDRQNHQTEAEKNPYHPEEDNDSKKESNRASCSPASTKQ